MQPKTIVIVGAGFSGTLTAINLARLKNGPLLHIYLIEQRGTFGPGLAYSPPTERFKLNVRAKAMGAFPEDPEGFFTWLKTREPTLSPDDFVPRIRYGEYLSHLLERAATEPGNNPIHRIHDEVLDISPDTSGLSLSVAMQKGGSLRADACVLALGNLPRTTLNTLPRESFRDPFSKSSYTDLPRLTSLLLIGSGLTAVDVIIESEAQGFKGSYTVVSRHGMFPRPHETPSHPNKVSLPIGWEDSISLVELLKLVRRESKRLGSSQPVIDAMRPQIQKVWAGLPAHERRRFLRHVKPFWEVHRHRVPTAHFETLERLKKQGRLSLLAGRILSSHSDGSRIQTEIRLRGAAGDHLNISTDAAFLCAGTEGELARSSSQLIKNLLQRRLMMPGELKLGASPSHTGTSDATSRRIWLIGPLQRESHWEITAVRELREAAFATAHEVVAALHQLEKNR